MSTEAKSTCKWKILIGPGFFTYNSPTFGDPESSVWRMELKTFNEETHLSFRLLSLARGKSVKVQCEATIKVDSEQLYQCNSEPTNLKPKATCLLKRFNINQSGNTHCVICWEVSFLPESSTIQTDAGLLTGPHSLTEDLSALLDSGEHADVVLCVAGTEVRAHKNLLSARSPVFAAMFRHDTREAQSSRVDIDDMDLDTVRELLRYIYTGSAAGVRQMAGQLLVAGDKYGLDGLKQLCEWELVGGLTADNAAQVGVVALRHDCEDLKRTLIGFVRENILRVLATDGWADAVINHPREVVELSRLIGDESGK